MSPRILVGESDTGFWSRGSGPPTELQDVKMRNAGQLRPSLVGSSVQDEHNDNENGPLSVAKCLAAPAPIPVLAPVMSTIFPSRPLIVLSSTTGNKCTEANL